MADDTNTAEREAFEAWFRREYHSRLDRNMPDKSYNDPGAHFKWIGWSARASLAASAGSEPVKRVFLVATGEEHEGEATYTRYDDAPPPLCDSECLYTHPSPPEGAGWRPIAEAPQNGCTLLLGYFNSAGKWRTTRGQWMSQDYIDEYAEDPDCMSPGWYETTVEDDDGKCWPIDPTHFMPMPPAPPASEAKGA